MTVLDTQSLLWWINSSRKLSKKARNKIQSEIKKDEHLLVSSISIWEISLLIKRGRLKLTMDIFSWVEKIESLPYIQFIPVDNKIAAKSVMLPNPLHDDPADRIIIATSLLYGATLITSDKKILNYPHMKSVW